MTLDLTAKAMLDFDRYKRTYTALNMALNDAEQRKEVLKAIEVKTAGESDQIYIKNVKLGFPHTQRIHLCHTVVMHSGVFIDTDGIVLKEPNETGEWSQELHYQLLIPWYEANSTDTADTPGTELPIKTFDPMCPDILEVEVTIKACDLISAAFLSTVTPAIPIHGARWTIGSFRKKEVEIRVSFEPDIPYNTYKDVVVFTNYKNAVVFTNSHQRKNTVETVSAPPPYEDLLRQLEEHIAIGKELTKEVAKLGTGQKAEEGDTRDVWF